MHQKSNDHTEEMKKVWAYYSSSRLREALKSLINWKPIPLWR
jgi:hypothetical protein